MRKSLAFLILAFHLAGGMLFADTLSLIPRRVYFSQTSSVAAMDEQRQALTGAILDYLYTSIAALQPIVRMDDPERAHSSVLVDLASEGEAVRIRVSLSENTQVQVERDFRLLTLDQDLNDYTRFINDTASVFAPYLDLVKPEVRESEFSDEKAMIEVVEETDFAEKLNKRFEITLWLSGLTQVFHEPTVAQPEQISIRPFTVFPIVIDAAYYFSRSFGIYISLFSDYNDFFAFDTIRDIDDTLLDKAESKTLFLLPGIGITYRTLGYLSAQFNAAFYYGWARVEALDDVGGVADAGEIAWINYSFLSLSFILGWNILPEVAVKTKFGMNIDMVHLFLMESYPYEFDHNGIFFNFFSIGASYRF
jgi:hypothetical protein